MKRALVALLLMISLVACGSDISSGTVTNKEHTAEWTQMTMTCYSYNSNGTCSVQMPTFTTWPEVFTLHLENDEGQTGYVEVSESTYGQYSIGSNYP